MLSGPLVTPPPSPSLPPPPCLYPNPPPPLDPWPRSPPSLVLWRAGGRREGDWPVFKGGSAVREWRGARGAEQARLQEELQQGDKTSLLSCHQDHHRDRAGHQLELQQPPHTPASREGGNGQYFAGNSGWGAACVSWKHGNCDSSASHNTPFDYFYSGDQNSRGARQAGLAGGMS